MSRSRRSFQISVSTRAALLVSGALLTGAAIGDALPWLLWVPIAMAFGLFVERHVHSCIAQMLRTADTLIEAIRMRDFGHRARRARADEPLAGLLHELNGLAEHLQTEHLRAVETGPLLEAIVERTEIGLLAFDDAKVLRWTNPAAERLFQIRPNSHLTAEVLGISDWFTAPPENMSTVPGQPLERTWEVRRDTFWRERRRYVFFLVSDSRRVRREQERVAWARLIRVIGHEVNNTLTPIQSLGGTCRSLLRQDPAQNSERVEKGLALIEQRAGSLLLFIGEYTRLAKLPPLRFGRVRLQDCIRVAVELEQHERVQIRPGPEVLIEADAAQLEQALVNLIRNAAEATLTTDGSSLVTWACAGEHVTITIVDDGPGIENLDNLFVPFFSTKAGGSGIGLTLSRNIIESHGGELQIANRSERSGCIVRIRLPLVQTDPSPRQLHEDPSLPAEGVAVGAPRS